MKGKLTAIFAGACALLIFVSSLSLGIYWESRKHQEPVITPSSISDRLMNASDLASAKLEYRGLIRYQDGNMAFLTKKAFTMVYDAKITAGIDLSLAQIEVRDNAIHVALPKATIQDVVIDPASLEFYDEKWALFNPEKKEDTVTALQEATENAKAYATETQLLENADTHVQRLIEELLAPTLERMTKDRKHPATIQFSVLEG